MRLDHCSVSPALPALCHPCEQDLWELTHSPCRSPASTNVAPATSVRPPACLVLSRRQDLGVPAVGAGDGWALQNAGEQAQPDPGQPEGKQCLLLQRVSYAGARWVGTGAEGSADGSTVIQDNLTAGWAALAGSAPCSLPVGAVACCFCAALLAHAISLTPPVKFGYNTVVVVLSLSCSTSWRYCRTARATRWRWVGRGSSGGAVRWLPEGTRAAWPCAGGGGGGGGGGGQLWGGRALAAGGHTSSLAMRAPPPPPTLTPPQTQTQTQTPTHPPYCAVDHHHPHRSGDLPLPLRPLLQGLQLASSYASTSSGNEAARRTSRATQDEGWYPPPPSVGGLQMNE